MKKRKKILLILLIGALIIIPSVSIPLIVLNKSKVKEKTSKEKLMDLTQKEQILDETNDLNLSNEINQIKILNFIKSKVSFLSKIEKNSIELVTKNVIISYNEIKKITFKVTLNKKEEEFIFKFKRKTTNQEKFNNLKIKFEKSNVNKTLQLYDLVDLNLNVLENRIKVKNAIINEINHVNTNKLSVEEKAAINITTILGIITNTTPINVNVEITFDVSALHVYTFRFTRIILQEKLNIFKDKFEKSIENKIFVLPDKVNLDMRLAVNNDKFKKAILDWIDQLNNDGFLNSFEKSKITIDDVQWVSNFIYETYANATVLTISFGTNQIAWNIEVTRTKTNFEKLKTKFEKSNVNKTLHLYGSVDLNLNVLENRTEVKNAIIDEINRVNNNNMLNREEKNAISILTTSGIITNTTPINVNVKITIDSNSKNYTFIFSVIT